MSNVITLDDPKYPALLKSIKNPPKQLFYEGRWREDLFKNTLAVVGSRNMTNYGKDLATKIVTALTSMGVVVVSGFMYGIDAVAHLAAINAGLSTVAVLPCGVNIIHPSKNRELYFELKRSQLLISEYPDNFAPKNWTYVKRNRIIAGLSQAVAVIEAAKESGSLLTAEFAIKENRKVFALPGNVGSTNSEGTLNLILNKKAEILLSSTQICDFFGIVSNPKAKSTQYDNNTGSRDGLQLLELLRREPMYADEISQKLNIAAKTLNFYLTTLLLEGLLKEENGKFYAN
ncbi:DNA-processing protein DprA [Patescibacteria group bacterium]|nr:DNA-processing protein DprA [Patescibacteria group bacterium]